MTCLNTVENECVSSSTSICHNSSWPALPSWARDNERKKWGEKLEIKEWDGPNSDGDDHNVEKYRTENGWKGNDLVHSSMAPVRVLEYRVCYGSKDVPSEIRLSGIVVFTSRAESHKGYCHGGSMCSVMDDIIGWTGFCVSGKCIPWSGYTVQVNCNLLKPIRVNTILRLDCVIDKVERRKVYVSAVLHDPESASNNDDCIHAKSEGMFVVNRGILPGH